MKKKTLISGFLWIAFIFLVSCEPQMQLTNLQKQVKAFGIDFRKYTEKGFLFMPNEYFGEYEVLGIIKVELHPEVRYERGRIKSETAHFFDDLNPIQRPKLQPPRQGYLHYYFTVGNSIYTQIISINETDELLEFIYNLSINWGGDAFTHLNHTIETAYTNESKNSAYVYDVISGNVIRRK